MDLPPQNQDPLANPSNTSLPASLGMDIGDPDIDLEDQDLAGIDLIHLEHAYQKKILYTIPLDQLRKVHKVFLKSSVGGSDQS
jgi:hypothetical protein